MDIRASLFRVFRNKDAFNFRYELDFPKNCKYNSVNRIIDTTIGAAVDS